MYTLKAFLSAKTSSTHPKITTLQSKSSRDPRKLTVDNRKNEDSYPVFIMVIFQPVIVILVAQEVFDDGFEHQDYVRSRHHEMKLHSKNISLTGQIYIVIHILCMSLYITISSQQHQKGDMWCWYLVPSFFPDIWSFIIHRKLFQVSWSLEDKVKSWRRPVTTTLLVGFTNRCKFMVYIVGGFNPFEKYWSNSFIYPGIGVKIICFKPPCPSTTCWPDAKLVNPLVRPIHSSTMA